MIIEEWQQPKIGLVDDQSRRRRRRRRWRRNKNLFTIESKWFPFGVKLQSRNRTFCDPGIDVDVNIDINDDDDDDDDDDDVDNDFNASVSVKTKLFDFEKEIKLIRWNPCNSQWHVTLENIK